MLEPVATCICARTEFDAAQAHRDGDEYHRPTTTGRTKRSTEFFGRALRSRQFDQRRASITALDVEVGRPTSADSAAPVRSSRCGHGFWFCALDEPAHQSIWAVAADDFGDSCGRRRPVSVRRCCHVGVDQCVYQEAVVAEGELGFQLTAESVLLCLQQCTAVVGH